MGIDLLEHRAETVIRLKAPGTCGELVQGHIDGQDFLVNCPIDLYAHATVALTDRPGLQLHEADRFAKIRDTVTLAAHELMFELRHRIAVHSDIPRGKGLASSTADISAALEAVLRSCDVAASPQVFARLLTEVEPSDCTHFPGIAHLNHLTGDLVETMPAPDDLRVLVVDCGGEVDTLGFERDKARAVYRGCRDRIAAAVALLRRGLHGRRADWVAEAATASARISQDILHKPQFDTLLRAALDEGALGVNCAHSGSVLGVLHRGRARLRDRLEAMVRCEFGPSLTVLGDHRVIAGGCVEQ
jgi:L-threonine kinase